MTFSQTFLVLTALVHYWSGVHSFEVPHQCDSAPILNLIDGDLNLERTPNSPGNVTLVTLLSANSRVGRRQAKDLQELKKTMNLDGVVDIDFVIINDAMAIRDRLRLEDLMDEDVQVLQDDGETSAWSQLGGKANDLFIYDRCGQLSFFIPYPLSKFSRPFVSVALNETYVKFPCDICPLLNPIDLGNDTSSASDEQDVDVDAVFEEDVGDVPVEREPGLATADPDSVETENAEITEDDVGVQPKQALSEEERRREMTLSTLLRYWEVKRFQSYVQQKDGGSVTGSPPEMPDDFYDDWHKIHCTNGGVPTNRNLRQVGAFTTAVALLFADNVCVNFLSCSLTCRFLLLLLTAFL